MRVIFLDIDGELTYAGYCNEETHYIDSEKVALLKEIVDATNAKIVLSSSWKCGYDKITGEKRSFYQTLENILSAMGLYISLLRKHMVLNYHPHFHMDVRTRFLCQGIIFALL